MLPEKVSQAGRQLMLWWTVVLLEIVLATLVALFPGPLLPAAMLSVLIFLLCFHSPYWGLVLITVFLPVRDLDFSIELGSTVIRISQILAVPTILGWFVNRLFGLEPLIRPTPINFFLAVLSFVFLLSVAWSCSFSGWLSKNAQWFLSLFLFFMSVDLINNRSRLIRFVQIWLFVGTVVGLMAILEFLFSGSSQLLQNEETVSLWAVRSSAVTREPNDLVIYLTYCIFFGIAFFDSLAKGKFRVLVFLCLLCILAGIMTTFSRGSILSLGVGLAFMLLRVKSLRSFLAKAGLLFLVLVLLSGHALDMFTVFSERLLSSFDFLSADFQAEQDVGYFVRIMNWQAGWTIFTRYPFLGIGLGGYAEMASSINPEIIADQPYSLYLDFLVSLGPVGLVLLLGFCFWVLGLCLYQASHIKDIFLGNMVFAGGALIVVKMFKGITGDVFIESSYFWLGLGLVFAGLLIDKTQSQSNESSQKKELC